MIDREKVIKGLEHCIEKLDTVTNKTHGFNCTACPYFKRCDSSGYLVGLPLMKDAIALLKAQEPRVVKISELTSGEPMLVWLEDIDKKETVAGMIFDYVPGRLGFKLTDLASMDRIYPLIDEYLTRWRCWTSRPDEKVRAETPWSD